MGTDFLTLLQMFEKFEFVEYEPVFQNILYFARVEPQEINIPETNALSWKLARTKWNGIFDLLKEYNPLGPKPGKVLSIFKGNIILEKLLPFMEETKYEEILTKYEDVVKSIFIETDLVAASSELPDANLCLILLSLGYMKIYETDKALLKKIFHFIIELMDLGKINLQLLVSCLSLLVLKEIKQTPNRDEIMNEIGDITDDEKEITIVDNFLKKIYYLYDK